MPRGQKERDYIACRAFRADIKLRWSHPWWKRIWRWRSWDWNIILLWDFEIFEFLIQAYVATTIVDHFLEPILLSVFVCCTRGNARLVISCWEICISDTGLLAKLHALNIIFFLGTSSALSVCLLYGEKTLVWSSFGIFVFLIRVSYNQYQSHFFGILFVCCMIKNTDVWSSAGIFVFCYRARA